MAIKNFGLAWIVVSDLKKAKKFFTDLVGMKVTSSSDEHGWIELSGNEGGATLGLSQENGMEPIKAGQNAVVTLTVQDLAKTRAEFAKKGVNLIGEIMEIPGHVKLQLFIDNDGNKFQLVEIIGGK